MLKSKLLVPVAVCVVIALASVNALEPQDDSNVNEASAASNAAQRSSVAGANSSVAISRFEDVASNATPENRWLNLMLSKPVPPLDFPGESPLSEILETIQTFYTQKYGAGHGMDGPDLRMTFYPDYAELDLEGISSLEDVTVDDIRFEGIQLRNALKLIFDQTTDPELTYVIENQVMKVTTLAKAESEDNLYTRLYNVGELADLKFRTGRLSRPRIPKVMANSSNAGAKGGGVGFFSVTSQKQSTKAAPSAVADSKIPVVMSDLETLIIEGTAPPARWLPIDGEGGAIRLVGHTLFVRQTPSVQKQIVSLLNMLDTDTSYHIRVYSVGELADLRFSADQLLRHGIYKPAPGNSADVAAEEPKRAPVADSNLEALIVEMAGGDWRVRDGEGGAIRRVGGSLVIRQTEAVHSRIVDLLDLLSRMDASENRGR